MSTHRDDDEIPPTLNKSVNVTYGKLGGSQDLHGVPVGNVNLDHHGETNSDDKSSIQEKHSELQGVPAEVLESVGNTETSDTNGKHCKSNTVSNTENVPDMVVDNNSVAQTEDTPDNDDTSLAEDATLPEIENVKEAGQQEIDLQQDLIPENVTLPDIEILEELSEFSNLLNLDDHLDSELPIADVRTADQPAVDVALDLEIAMDNAKFLEAHPIEGSKGGTHRAMS